MKIHSHKDAKKIFDQGTATGHLLAQSDTVEYVTLNLDPGAAIPAHSLEIPIHFYIISGRGRLTVDNETVAVNPGDMIMVEPGTQRAWENDSETTLRILGIKFPNS